MSIFSNKNVLITGGTGSLGQAFAKRLLQEDQCGKVIIFSRDELKQWQMKQNDPIFNHPKIRYFLGDIRDLRRLHRAFNEVDYILHAAALKQVPAAEYNPSEFIYTNIVGGINIIDAAIDCNVEKVVALSTDKAVNPVNLYGATKLCSDKLFVAGNAYVGAKKRPQLSVARYGNVVGSRGSIIPLWLNLLKDKKLQELPLTDPLMTRFWITLDQAVDFVMLCFKEMRGGEIFVPKIPSSRLVDLAEAIAPGVPQKYTGIREGEKLHELMISLDDGRHTIEFEDHYIILPEIYANDPERFKAFLDNREGKPVPPEFVYASNTNTQWLSVKQIRDLIHDWE